MSGTVKYFWVLSFTVDDQAGVSIVLADSQANALLALKQAGKYNGTPDKYVLVQALNVGQYDGPYYGLMLESYTNAMVAYDALVDVAKDIKGDKGDKGDRGPAMEVYIGSVTQTEIGTDPTVVCTETDRGFMLEFTFPKYDISPESRAALKAELYDELYASLSADLKDYVDGLFEAQAEELEEWKDYWEEYIEEHLPDDSNEE